MAAAARSALAMFALACGAIALSGACANRQGSSLPDASAVLDSALALHQLGQMEAEAALLTSAISSWHSSNGAASLADLHARLGYVYRYAGLMDESIGEYQQSLQLDSSSERAVSVNSQIAKSLIYLGRYHDALAAHRAGYRLLEDAGMEADEKFLMYHGVSYFYAGDSTAATELFDASVTRAESLWSSFSRGYRFALTGQADSLLALASELERRNDIADPERRYRLVHMFALAGEANSAIEQLSGAVEAGFFNAPHIESDPFLESLRQDPRFASLLQDARSRHDAFRAARASYAADRHGPPPAAVQPD